MPYSECCPQPAVGDTGKVDAMMFVRPLDLL
jgi:hypothetical protein